MSTYDVPACSSCGGALDIPMQPQCSRCLGAEKANLSFNALVGEAERLLRRTPASLARLDGEIHVLLLAPRDHAVCPTCKTCQPGPFPPAGVMFECAGCGDGLIIRNGR